MLVEAAKPTTDFCPAWHTSIPMTITLSFYMNGGNLTRSDSPPTLVLICFMMFEATDKFILLAVLFTIT